MRTLYPFDSGNSSAVSSSKIAALLFCVFCASGTPIRSIRDGFNQSPGHLAALPHFIFLHLSVFHSGSLSTMLSNSVAVTNLILLSLLLSFNFQFIYFV